MKKYFWCDKDENGVIMAVHDDYIVAADRFDAVAKTDDAEVWGVNDDGDIAYPKTAYLEERARDEDGDELAPVYYAYNPVTGEWE